METLSFILGMSSVVIIAIAVVAVIGFFKVRSVEKQFNEYRQNFTVEFENRTKDIHDNLNSLHRRIDNTEREVFSQLDSRLDKLETKLTSK